MRIVSLARLKVLYEKLFNFKSGNSFVSKKINLGKFGLDLSTSPF
jgi:hypothetical protein